MIIVWCLLTAGLVLFLATCVTWLYYVPLIARAFIEPPFLYAKSFPSLEGMESCEFTAVDGVVLRGSYSHDFPHSPGRRGLLP